MKTATPETFLSSMKTFNNIPFKPSTALYFILYWLLSRVSDLWDVEDFTSRTEWEKNFVSKYRPFLSRSDNYWYWYSIVFNTQHRHQIIIRLCSNYLLKDSGFCFIKKIWGKCFDMLNTEDCPERVKTQQQGVSIEKTFLCDCQQSLVTTRHYIL